MTRMNRFDARRIRLWRPAWWQLALLAAVGIAVILAIAIVATSLILIIAPVVLVAVLAQRFLARRAARRGDVYPGARVQVIDAEYEIVADRKRDEGRD
jgi:membrane protein implicated in regulation of membrane protease activity